MNQEMPPAPAPVPTPAPMPEEPRKSNTNTWLIVGIVLVVLCCCCLGAVAIYALWQNGDRWFGTGASLLGAMRAASILIS